jgi:hypothetical protein
MGSTSAAQTVFYLPASFGLQAAPLLNSKFWLPSCAKSAGDDNVSSKFETADT